jgi:hypothetical protein
MLRSPGTLLCWKVTVTCSRFIAWSIFKQNVKRSPGMWRGMSCCVNAYPLRPVAFPTILRSILGVHEVLAKCSDVLTGKSRASRETASSRLCGQAKGAVGAAHPKKGLLVGTGR